MTRYKTHTINSTTEFVEFIHMNCVPDDILFRGQFIDAPLLPKLARLEFRNNILKAEMDMIEELMRRSPPLLDIEPKSLWDWLAIAQHYGMATRLLDWTLNPLAALWFAVNQPPDKKDNILRPGVVWILAPTKSDYADISNIVDPFNLRYTKIFRPNHIVPRLVNQAGWFTVHWYKKSEKRFIPLEENSIYSRKLTKLRIPPDSFVNMRCDLDRFNVNASALFPDIDGLCSHIQWLHTYLEDE